jgi:uncharacterized protein YdaU (DUF1376 family)
MSKTDIWMPLYIADYLADTQHLTRDEHGAYLLLMMAYWRTGTALPDDDKRLAAICKASPKEWKELRPTLAEFFTVGDGVWHQKRIEEEYAKAMAFYAKQKANGSKGGRPKKTQQDSQNKPTGFDRDKPNESPSQSPSSSSFSEQTTSTTSSDDSSSASSADEIAQMLAKLEGERGVSSRFKPGDRRIEIWVQAGITIEKIKAAYAAAVQQRIKDGDPSAVNTGLIDSILAAWTNDPGSSVVPGVTKAWHETATGIDLKAKELGMPDYTPDIYGTWQQFRVCVFNKAQEAMAA